jgi:hypothetical protein
MTGLMRGWRIGFPQVEFTVGSQSSGQWLVASKTGSGLDSGSVFRLRMVKRRSSTVLRAYSATPLISDRVKALAGSAATAIGLGRLAGEIGRERDSNVSRTRLGSIVGAVHFSLWRRRRCRERFSQVRKQGYVDIFEDLPGCDAENTIGGFDEVVAFATGVLTAENVGEGETGGELLGFDQKAGAVGDPWGCFHVLTRSSLLSMVNGDGLPKW